MTDCVFNSLKQTRREPIVSVHQLKVLAHAREQREGSDETWVFIITPLACTITFPSLLPHPEVQ